MNASDPAISDGTFDLSAGGPSVVLDETGFRLRTRPGRRARRIPYSDITHLDASRRGLWLGTRRSVLLIRRHRFRGSQGPEELARALAARVAQQPGGLHQLGRWAEIDHLLRARNPRRATVIVSLLCLGVYTLQLRDPFLYEVGAFVPELVLQGEPWRIFTANFLHGFVALPLHLGLNLLGLLGFAYLVERPLGFVPTVVVLGVSAVAAMGASALAQYPEVVGASGMVAGLAGAALCLELHFPEKLPAWWRIPRRFYIAVLVAEGAYGFAIPVIAGAAHLGGFIAGYAAALWLAARALARQPVTASARAVAIGLGTLTALSFAAAAPLLLRDGSALARHAKSLLATTGVHATRYNDLAWRMVTEAELAPEEADVAVELAERAVGDTDRRDPDVLDTLAEALFARGDRDAAVETIDEAITLAPRERYFREQRRRFTGERAPDDRPEPPHFPWSFREPPGDPVPRDPDPGVAI